MQCDPVHLLVGPLVVSSVLHMVGDIGCWRRTEGLRGYEQMHMKRMRP
jgi:hypothetical protein